MVVVVESASVGDELDVIATDRIQFGGPELVMCGVIGEVNEGGYTIEFSVTEACHKGGFIELSELCPSNSRELFLQCRRECLPIDPFFVRYNDS